MVASVENAVIDSGLTYVNTNSAFIYICSTEPTTYASASTTALLGTKSWGAGAAFGAPAANVNARQVASVAITDGTITTTGTASWWAVATTAALVAHGTLSASQVVTNGNLFTLASFLIKVPTQ
jgi:hypothetical protein